MIYAILATLAYLLIFLFAASMVLFVGYHVGKCIVKKVFNLKIDCVLSDLRNCRCS